MFRVLMCNRDPYTTIPLLSMVLYNDLHYLARECFVIFSEYPTWPKEYSFADQVGPLRDAATQMYKLQVVGVSSEVDTFRTPKKKIFGAS